MMNKPMQKLKKFSMMLRNPKSQNPKKLCSLHLKRKIRRKNIQKIELKKGALRYHLQNQKLVEAGRQQQRREFIRRRWASY